MLLLQCMTDLETGIENELESLPVQAIHESELPMKMFKKRLRIH